MTFGWVSIVRLGLVQMALGAVVVLTTSTLNRLMVVELTLPATLPGFSSASITEFRSPGPAGASLSDIGGRRTRWIIGGMATLAAGAFGAALGVALFPQSFALALAPVDPVLQPDRSGRWRVRNNAPGASCNRDRAPSPGCGCNHHLAHDDRRIAVTAATVGAFSGSLQPGPASSHRCDCRPRSRRTYGPGSMGDRTPGRSGVRSADRPSAAPDRRASRCLVRTRRAQFHDLRFPVHDGLLHAGADPRTLCRACLRVFPRPVHLPERRPEWRRFPGHADRRHRRERVCHRIPAKMGVRRMPRLCRRALCHYTARKRTSHQRPRSGGCNLGFFTGCSPSPPSDR